MKALFCAFVLAIAVPSHGLAQSLRVASTTSVQDSGLFAFLLPKFESRFGIKVEVVSRPSAAAIAVAERGSADVIIVNDSKALDRFVGSGNATRRHPLMHNDFVIVGPVSDPAGVAGMNDAPAALRAIAKKRVRFVSRGDESGTHAAERRLWQMAEVDPKSRAGQWYVEAGMGMGATVEMATQVGGYILTDRASWLAHGAASHRVLVEGDPRLFDQYEVAVVSAAKHPTVNAAAAASLVDWLISAEAQQAITAFRIGGQQAFFPGAQVQN